MSLSEPGLDREAADRALERLGDECDRIAEALVAMDGHPGHQLLRGASLTGLTHTRWVETSTAMATLWEQFDAYRTLLDRAREVRARRSRPGQEELDELTELLTGKVVELNREQLPIERRSLTGPAQNVERITLTALVTKMKDAYATVTAVLAEADTAWTNALTRLDPLENELRSALAAAESVGTGKLDELNTIRERLAEAREQAMTDPLALTGNDPLTSIETELARLKSELAVLATTRDSVNDRIARIADALSQIEATQREAGNATAVVIAKIANPNLPALHDLTPPLRARLTNLQPLINHADWPRLAQELDQLDQATAQAKYEARAQLAVRTGLLDRRAELRGRLDAYRAKAARHGRAEDLELGALHTRAYELLYTAPCDLAAATRAVNRYQQAVTHQEGPR
jgi:chromosome segregation ATPase